MSSPKDQVDDELSHVPAANLVRNFARYSDLSLSQPVFVTRHGRRTHVLMSADQFDKVAQARPLQPGDQPAASTMLFTLADWMDEGLVICDEDLTVRFINRVGQAITRKSPEELIGRQLFAGLPDLAESLIAVHTRRTQIGGQPSLADIPSPFTGDCWLRFTCFRIDRCLMLKFRDITEDVERHRKADVKQAIQRGMSTHGRIAYIRLSVRGTIDRVDLPFCELLDLPETRLKGVQIADLVAVPDKPRVREMLEQVLRGGEPQVGTVRFLTNPGALLTARLSITVLQGLYGTEGAVVLLTPGAPDQDPGRRADQSGSAVGE